MSTSRVVVFSESRTLLSRGPRLAAPQLGHHPGGHPHGVHQHRDHGPRAGHQREPELRCHQPREPGRDRGVHQRQRLATQVNALQAKIRALPQLRSYYYISNAQALRIFERRLGRQGKEIIANLVGDPLPASYVIYVKDPNQVDAVAARFFNDPAVDNSPGTHDGVRYAQATVRRMLGTIDLVTKGMWIATLLFALAGVLLISTTVRLSIFSRRHEVEIMRLVGATNWFIRWPFMLEGFITGLVGSVLAAVAIYLLNLTIFNWIRSSAINFLKVELYPVWFRGGWWPLGLLPTLVIMGAVLGALGSAVALRRYLRV